MTQIAEQRGKQIATHLYGQDQSSRATLEEIRADILALERETKGLLDEIIGEVEK